MPPFQLPPPPPPGAEPPPQQLPINPAAAQMQRPVQMGLQGPPPPQGPQALPPPPSEDPGFLRSAAPFLPAALGLGLGIFGKGNTSHFGAGMATGSSNQLLGLAQQKRQQDAEKEQHAMKNVGGRVEKARRLASTNPAFAEVARAYDSALADGKFDAKEAARVGEMLDGLPDVEGLLAQQESDLAIKQYTAQQQARAEIERKLKDRNRQDYKIGDEILSMDPEDYVKYKIAEESAKRADERAGKRDEARAKFEDAKDRRFYDRLSQQDRQFGNKQDEKFQGKLDSYYGAEEAIRAIDDSLQRWSQASIFSPLEASFAAQELDSTVKGLSTIIGRNLGERGVFTDQDRATFSKIITPGLVISKLSPEEAQTRLSRLKSMLQKVKSREIDAYRNINPNSKLPEVGKEGLTPPPLPPIAQRQVGQSYIMKDGNSAVWNGNGFD